MTDRERELEEFAKRVRDNFDCDTGANGAHPDYCRACCARDVLEAPVYRAALAGEREPLEPLKKAVLEYRQHREFMTQGPVDNESFVAQFRAALEAARALLAAHYVPRERLEGLIAEWRAKPYASGANGDYADDLVRALGETPPGVADE